MNRGRPVKPEAKRQRNMRVIRLNDYYSAALDEIAEEDGSNASQTARKFIQEGIRRRLTEKRARNVGTTATA